MTARIFIDGEVGTTGLQIRTRLATRADVTLVSLPTARRKDPAARTELLNSVDLVVLCLPDAAARDAVTMIVNPHVRVIDASSAHRVTPGWVYGFPEMSPGHAAAIASARRVTNPGCYPTGAIALLRPLVAAGVIPEKFPITVNAVSGYSGGGRGLITRYEDPAAPDRLESPFWVYGLGLEHKHVPEMRVHSLLANRPLFVPSVGRYAQGMIVQVPLQCWALPGKPSAADLQAILVEAYRGCEFVSVAGLAEAQALTRLDPEACNNTNEMRLYCFGNDERQQVVLSAVLDNLGKGAAGAAVQNMNLMLGLDPAAGLIRRAAAELRQA